MAMQNNLTENTVYIPKMRYAFWEVSLLGISHHKTEMLFKNVLFVCFCSHPCGTFLHGPHVSGYMSSQPRLQLLSSKGSWTAGSRSFYRACYLLMGSECEVLPQDAKAEHVEGLCEAHTHWTGVTSRYYIFWSCFFWLVLDICYFRCPCRCNGETLCELNSNIFNRSLQCHL